MTMFALADSEFSTAHVELDLVGARICRPAALNTYDMLDDGMIEPIISLETATDLATCFDDLLNGIVDVVSVNGLTADVYFTEKGKNSKIVLLAEMASNHTVHAIAANNNPGGMVALQQLNTGLRKIRASGGWGEIARGYLLNHN